MRAAATRPKITVTADGSGVQGLGKVLVRGVSPGDG